MNKKSYEVLERFERLFGSKTRTKLLKLFFSDSDKSYYVREISRTVDEQINSVRRELANLKELGLVKSELNDNKLYFSANKVYQFCDAFTEIFSNKRGLGITGKSRSSWWEVAVKPVRALVRALVVVSRVRAANLGVDLIIVGNNSNGQLAEWANSIENRQGRELKYVIMKTEDFRYRVNIRDKFMSDVLASGPMIIIDDDNTLKENV